MTEHHAPLPSKEEDKLERERLSDARTALLKMYFVEELPSDSDEDEDDGGDPPRLVDVLRAHAAAHRSLTNEEKLALQIKTITETLINVAKEQGKYRHAYALTTCDRFFYPALPDDLAAYFKTVAGLEAHVNRDRSSDTPDWHLFLLSWE